MTVRRIYRASNGLALLNNPERYRIRLLWVPLPDNLDILSKSLYTSSTRSDFESRVDCERLCRTSSPTKPKSPNCLTLFEISFVLGWLFGGGDITKLGKIKKAAKHFGMAFQIADDIKDMKKDKDSSNIAIMVGRKEAENMFKKELFYFKKHITSLNIFTAQFQKIENILRNTISS